MIITNPVNAPAIGTAVWQNASRTLTSLYSTLIFQNSGYVSLAASANIALQPSVSQCWIIGIGIRAGAAGTTQILFSDGTSSAALATIAAGNNGGLGSIVITNAAYVVIINNDAVNATTYAYSALRLS